MINMNLLRSSKKKKWIPSKNMPKQTLTYKTFSNDHNTQEKYWKSLSWFYLKMFIILAKLNKMGKKKKLVIKGVISLLMCIS